MTATNPLLLRVVTALVLLAVFLPAVLFSPPWLWALLVTLVVAAGAYEWARLSEFPCGLQQVYAALVGMVALGVYLQPAAEAHLQQAALFILAALFWAFAAPLWLATGWQGRTVFVRAATGLILLLPTGAALVYLRGEGPGILVAILAIVWIADTAAYFSGRAFGRRKLAPRISPGKTWEGVAGALLVLLIYAWAMHGHLPAVPLALLFAMIAALLYFSVLGDLFESWIKRVAEVKDSGSLLPGHGGVLDRIDAMTSALPLAAGMLMLVEKLT